MKGLERYLPAKKGDDGFTDVICHFIMRILAETNAQKMIILMIELLESFLL
jgi:hypothetical protein